MAVQAGYLAQVKEAAGVCPVVCAGDIFDRWNPSPELINFALKHLPEEMICVPGQHDLPNHRMEDMHRSGYGVLVEANKIIDISRHSHPKGTCRMLGDDHLCVCAWGFGWNEEITPCDPDRRVKGVVNLAVIHRYCWKEGRNYPGAPDTANVSAFKKQLKGYDVAVFGDNHLRFMDESGNCTVVNCGGFIRRKSDEITRKPAMALLYQDGSVEWKRLDVSGDVFHDGVEDRPENPLDLKAFIDGLESLGEQGLDFRAAVENHLRKDDISDEVKDLVRKAIDSHGT